MASVEGPGSLAGRVGFLFLSGWRCRGELKDGEYHDNAWLYFSQWARAVDFVIGRDWAVGRANCVGIAWAGSTRNGRSVTRNLRTTCFPGRNAAGQSASWFRLRPHQEIRRSDSRAADADQRPRAAGAGPHRRRLAGVGCLSARRGFSAMSAAVRALTRAGCTVFYHGRPGTESPTGPTCQGRAPSYTRSGPVQSLVGGGSVRRSGPIRSAPIRPVGGPRSSGAIVDPAPVGHPFVTRFNATRTQARPPIR